MDKPVEDHLSEEILQYWIDTLGPPGWYRQDEAVDAEIRDRFGQAWHDAAAGQYRDWQGHPRKALALAILLDQFPRNMFRDEARAFATDRQARAVACNAIEMGWDRRADEPERQFFYLPFMHSETLSDQEKGVRMIKERMPETGTQNLLHARAHREVIRRFGRFPHRNGALDRPSTRAERAFEAEGGYGTLVREVREAA